MKKIFLSFWAAALMLAAVALSSNAVAAEPIAVKTDDAQLKVMTFNLRYKNESDPYPWSKRKAVIGEFINDRKPDIFGTQEGLYIQLVDMVEAAPDYAWLGEGRDGGSKGEFMAIFYRKDRFKVLEYDHLWLSETPRTIASKSWNTACTRMVTWARFEDKLTGKQFYFANTHLDHVSQEARTKGSQVIASAIEKLNKNLPLIVTGDFNTSQTNEQVHGIFEKLGMQDTWDVEGQKRGPLVNTFNNFKMPKKDGVRIDWIFVRPADTKVLSSEIVLPVEGEIWLSDHSPVISVIELP